MPVLQSGSIPPMNEPLPRRNIRVRIRWLSRQVFVEFAGMPEDLLAAGVVSAEMLQPGQRGMRRFDAEGDSFAVTRQYNTGRVVVSRWKSPAQAAAFPGVARLMESERGPHMDGVSHWVELSSG